MPKATVNKHNFPAFREDDVRLTGQLGITESKAIAESMEKAANDHFRLGISPLDARHQLSSPVGDCFIHGLTD